jgi:hypothetical protein
MNHMPAGSLLWKGTNMDNKSLVAIEGAGEPMVNDAARLAVAASIDAPAVVAEKRTRNMPCPCGSGRKYKNCCLKREGRRVNVPPPGAAAGKLPDDGKRWCDASEADQDTFLGQLSQYVERALPPGPSRNGRALYVFVMFDPDKPGQAVHVANCDVRTGVPEAFRQLATAFEKETPSPHPSPDTVEGMALNALATLVEATAATRDLLVYDANIAPTVDALDDAFNYASGVIAYAKDPRGAPVPQVATVEDTGASAAIAEAEENAAAEFDPAQLGTLPERGGACVDGNPDEPDFESHERGEDVPHAFEAGQEITFANEPEPVVLCRRCGERATNSIHRDPEPFRPHPVGDELAGHPDGYPGTDEESHYVSQTKIEPPKA